MGLAAGFSNDLKNSTSAPVVGWNDRSTFAQRIRNYTDKEINVEIRRSFDGHVIFRSKLLPKLHDDQTIQVGAQGGPGEKKELCLEVIPRQGRNAKLSNVTLDGATVSTWSDLNSHAPAGTGF